MTRPPSPPTEPSSILQLYAELLLHIRTVTLFALLRTAHTSETKAVLSADGETLTLTHQGQSASIRLPTQISGGGTAALTLPRAPSKELTLRLQLQEKSPGLLRLRQGAENMVPWDARQLQEAESVDCAKCGAQLAVANPGHSDSECHQARSESANGGGAEAPRVGVNTWLDLPNENWAEMMDFWHCHKPHEHNHGNHNHEGEERGYAASNKLTARKGVGYVDLAYLLLAEEDCIGVKLSSFRSHLLCSSCNSHVGLFDHRSNGFRLWKWSLSVARKQSSVPQSYSPIKWVSAQLLSLIENQGVRKFTVIPDDEPEATKVNEDREQLEPIEIWVFTPDISFSSSVPHPSESPNHTPTDPTRAMKVMWKPAARLQPDNEHGQAIDRQSLAVEEARLPEHVFKALKDTLRNSGTWVPDSARKMGEWNVGLLERFAGEEI